MNQTCEMKIFPTSGPCQHRTKGKKRCGLLGFGRLEGGTARCKAHLQELMDWIENVSRRKGGKER